MTSVLFTGYAPVHYACFKPLADALARRDDVELHVGGGLRTREPDGTYRYDGEGMYRPFGVPANQIRSLDELGDMDVDVLFAANTKAISPRSAACRIQIFHGLSFRNRAVRPENAGYDAYFTIGPYMLRTFERLGILGSDDPRLVRVGFPKTDPLLDGRLNRRALLDEHGLSGQRPVVLFAPTGARGNSLETCGEEMLARLVAADFCDILVKPHDHPKNRIDWHARLAPLEGEHLRLVRHGDVIPTLFIADLLISDASSVAYEFALLDRPIVFVDVPDLLAAAAAQDGRLDLETWGRKAGVVAGDAPAVVEAVRSALQQPEALSQVRRAMTNDLFFNPGGATRAAVDWLDRKVFA